MLINQTNKQELYELLCKYLSLLVNTKFFSSQKKHHSSITKTISEYLSLLYGLAREQKDKEKEVEFLIKSFLENYSYSQDIDKYLDYSDKSYSDLKDEINYLKICAQNIFKVDLDTINLEELKKKETVTAREYSSHISSRAEAVNGSFEEFIATEDHLLDNNFINNLVIKNSAGIRINQDIERGTIYIYKNKPKRNVIIKSVIQTLLGLVIAFAGFAFAASLNKFVEFSIFSLIVATCYPSFVIYKISQSLKNDNYKYSFQKNTVAHLIALTLIFGIFFADFPKSEQDTYMGNLAQNKFACGSIAFLVLATTIYLVSLLWLQPEKDQEMIDKTLEKHMSEISKNASINN